MLAACDGDVLLEILRRSDTASALTALSSCRSLRSRREDLCRALAHAWWGREFWRRAALRPAHRRHAFASWRDELVRLERFQRAVDRLGAPRWECGDFCAYWKGERIE